MGIILIKVKQDKFVLLENEFEMCFLKFIYIDFVLVWLLGYYYIENIQEQVFMFENDIVEKEIVILSEQSIEDWVVNSLFFFVCMDVL